MNSKIVKYLIMVSTAVIAAVSCGDDEVTPLSTFELYTHLVKAGVDGGSFTVDFDIDGPASGVIADAVSDADWIVPDDVSQCQVEFTVSGNTTGKVRTGAITLSAEGTETAVLHIMQSTEASGQTVFHNFGISVSDITTSGARIEVDPVNPAMPYLYSVYTKSGYDALGPEKYIQEIVAQIQQMAAIYGVSPDAFLMTGYYDSAGESGESMNFSDNTEYYAIAFDLSFDENGNASYSGEVETCQFRTLPATQVGMTFSLSMSGSSLTVAPSGNYTYICDVTTKEIWDSYSSPEELAREYATVLRNYGVLQNYILSGPQTVDFQDVVSDNATEYVAYAVGYRNTDEDRGLTTKVSWIEYSLK
ncbi:MAG: BACON domain-containing carbohydrate-binding protein [Bacteroidales bacterium]|nr:BACON domain-containing carbohydrate-binding protein [Bacteroidales bacterium]